MPYVKKTIMKSNVGTRIDIMYISLAFASSDIVGMPCVSRVCSNIKFYPNLSVSRIKIIMTETPTNLHYVLIKVLPHAFK